MTGEDDLLRARAVADAVMYEGYLLYPYRASAAKNQIRWQFGVLGPQGACEAGLGEASDLATEILVRHQEASTVTVLLRFLQLQSRSVESAVPGGGFVGVEELRVGDQRIRAWDEAVEQEVVVASVPINGSALDTQFPVSVPGSEADLTELRDTTGELAGRLVRCRRPLQATVRVRVIPLGAMAAGEGCDASRLEVRVENLAQLPGIPDEKAALGRSLLGAHLLLTIEPGAFVSLLDPPEELRSAADACHQHRCWPVLVGPSGSSQFLMVSPIILEDHPTLAQESPGALFDSTEIDEILTLRILTMTDEEKAEARATDPRAGAIIDRSEGLSPEEMGRLHGRLRDPHALEEPLPSWTTPVESTSEVPWWDPERDSSVDPGTDTVMIAGRAVGRGSLVRIHPNRRADAQDLFYADRRAKVNGVHFDVDGAIHVGVVLLDDPAAEVNEWYGRFLYFAPDELEPLAPMEHSDALGTQLPAVHRKEI